MIFKIVLSLAFTAALQASPVISIQSAIEKSLLNSPDYISAKNEMESADLAAQNAFSAFFPSLDLSASHGVRGFDPDTNGLTDVTAWSSGATLSLTENFYDNGENYKKNRQAEARLSLAKVKYDRARARVIRQVVLAYYRHNIAWQNLNFTKKNYEELERLAKIVSNQFFQGLKTKKDFLRFKTRAQRSRLDVIRAENNLIEAKSNLLQIMGLSPDQNVSFDLSVKPFIPKTPLDLKIQESELFEYKILQLQSQISQIDVNLAKRRYWPELSLVGAASYGSQDYIDTRQTWSDGEQTSWSLFLNLKFNLIDWGVRNRNIQIAKLSQVSAEESVRLTLLDVQKDLEVFKDDVEKSQESYKLSKELQKMEEETFQILERDYKAGQTTYLELSTGLANLLDAQSLGLEADYNQADLHLRWKYYKGILNEQTALQ
jgi:outer membrane protein